VELLFRTLVSRSVAITAYNQNVQRRFDFSEKQERTLNLSNPRKPSAISGKIDEASGFSRAFMMSSVSFCESAGQQNGIDLGPHTDLCIFQICALMHQLDIACSEWPRLLTSF